LAEDDEGNGNGIDDAWQVLYENLNPKDGLAEDDEGNFQSVYMRHSL
jgi:hypothetical protein